MGKSETLTGDHDRIGLSSEIAKPTWESPLPLQHIISHSPCTNVRVIDGGVLL